ncbi:UNKNOWN [Stylonychia lemnae]|uniref:Alginate lyase 2 domain-containing protein n=1 Tax=Stylonychia lemnae TaxID=5949 RepID=A0A078ASV5_STYLE|nr:UNKNOWN [Stylonychia lemnae]|eukprot:CDW85101.1 UNKNOWN [Stylonychia lemnae]
MIKTKTLLLVLVSTLALSLNTKGHHSSSGSHSTVKSKISKQSSYNSPAARQRENQLVNGWDQLKKPSKIQYSYGDNKQHYKNQNGVETFTAYRDGNAFKPHSDTFPRSEHRIQNDYRSGDQPQQFSADFKVPKGTNSATIMQIFGGNKSQRQQKQKPNASSFMFQVHNNDLTYYKHQILAKDITGKWEHMNVIHDPTTHQIHAYLNGDQVWQGRDKGNDVHYFKYGVYGQGKNKSDMSPQMQSLFKNVKYYEKPKIE